MKAIAAARDKAIHADATLVRPIVDGLPPPEARFCLSFALLSRMAIETAVCLRICAASGQ
jgi:hypothetical protein